MNYCKDCKYLSGGTTVKHTCTHAKGLCGEILPDTCFCSYFEGFKIGEEIITDNGFRGIVCGDTVKSDNTDWIPVFLGDHVTLRLVEKVQHTDQINKEFCEIYNYLKGANEDI